MDSSTTAGTIGHLTLDEERKLQQAWTQLLQICSSEDVKSATTNGGAGPSQVSVSNDAFRQRLWSMFLADHPDVTILRFLRARKWDVEKAIQMLTLAVTWREERRIDEEIIQKGESVGLKASPTVDEQAFMTQYRSGKTYVRSTDKENRPIFIIKVRLHEPSKQSAESMENFVLHNVETMKAMMTSPREKACLIFDLTGFGLRNMDFHVVKFLCLVFEAKYPETLGTVLVHNAPFIFWGLWSMIKPWLDPVIESKINFTSKSSDLQKFISKENLQKCYGGQDTWEYKYLEPSTSENDRLNMEEKRAEIQMEHDEITILFEQATIEWSALDPGSDEGKGKSVERNELAKKLRESYWKLDPYIRARTYYHRTGVLESTGKADFKAAA